MSVTLERMRADVAEMLYESPDSIGDEDNLMDLGLDSMRALNLVLQWSEAGVALDFAEMAQHATLAGWWRVVRARQGPATIA